MNGELIEGMSDKEYFAIDALNASTIKAMVNPELHKWNLDHPEIKECFAFGGVFHDYVLRGIKPENSESVSVAEFDDFRTKKAKEWKAEKEKEGVFIITKKNIDLWEKTVHGMSEAICSLPEYEEHLSESKNEVVILWDRMTSGGFPVKCKAKLDNFVHGNDVLFDLKSIADLDNAESSIYKMNYYISAQWYREAANEIDGTWKRFKFAFAGKTKPYQAKIWEVNPALYDLAQAEIEMYCEDWRQCKESNIWPSGYSSESEVGSVPGWFWHQKGVEQ